MSTYKELIYMVADLAKQISDDSTLTNNHIAFLLNKYRTYLLKQRYNNKAQSIPSSNYQTVCSNLKYTGAKNYVGCCKDGCGFGDKDSYILRSEKELTNEISFANTTATLVRCSNEVLGVSIEGDEALEYFTELTGIEDPSDYATRCEEDANDVANIINAKYPSSTTVVKLGDGECNEDMLYDSSVRSYGNIQMVSKERFPYVGSGKYSKNTIYGTIGVDNRLYIKSKKDITKYTTAFVTSMFENPDKAYENSSCTYTNSQGEIVNCPSKDNSKCDPWDNTFPIEDALQAPLINMVLKDILGAAYRPADDINDARDNQNDINSFVRQNMKQQFVRQQQPQDIE